jgi:hypothetical protein
MTSLQITCAALGHMRNHDLVCVVCGDAPRSQTPPRAIVVRDRRRSR